MRKSELWMTKSTFWKFQRWLQRKNAQQTASQINLPTVYVCHVRLSALSVATALVALQQTCRCFQLFALFFCHFLKQFLFENPFCSLSSAFLVFSSAIEIMQRTLAASANMLLHLPNHLCSQHMHLQLRAWLLCLIAWKIFVRSSSSFSLHTAWFIVFLCCHFFFLWFFTVSCNLAVLKLQLLDFFFFVL